jgi:uncharacterized protein YhbP (UPF0306 family)
MSNNDQLAIDQEIELFLATCRTASLATVDDQGQPHAANVQYAHDGAWRLHWISSPDSAHSRHTTQKPAAAISIYAHRDEPETIHGLQMHGRVSAGIALGQEHWNRIWDLYTNKYRFVASLPQMRVAAEKQRFYVFTPTWVRWIDNRRGFGWKLERFHRSETANEES